MFVSAFDICSKSNLLIHYIILSEIKSKIDVFRKDFKGRLPCWELRQSRVNEDDFDDFANFETSSVHERKDGFIGFFQTNQNTIMVATIGIQLFLIGVLITIILLIKKLRSTEKEGEKIEDVNLVEVGVEVEGEAINETVV